MANKDNNNDSMCRDTVVHMLLHWEKQQPNTLYMTQPLSDGSVVKYTWAQVVDQVRRMAAYLQGLNLPEHSSIAIIGKNSAHWVMADMAILMAGHVSVPLYPTLNAETAGFVLDHSDTCLVFIGKLDGKTDSWNEVKDILPSDIPCIGLPLSPQYPRATAWDDIIGDTQPTTKPVLQSGDAMATIMYTSGSTGRPKGVMHNFKAMLSVAKLAEQEYDITSEDRVLSYLPMAHAAERILVETLSVYTGCQVFFANDLSTFQQDLRRASPTFFFSVPRLWTKFYQGVNQKISPAAQKILLRLPIIKGRMKSKILDQLGLSDVRVAITGSAPLPIKLVNWYWNIGLELLEGYGMTENVAYSHTNKLGENMPGYVGYPNEGVECRIDDNGEILVKSPGNMMGYYKNPEKTAADLTDDGFFRTGDMGEINADGCLKITGRVKDIFKTSKGKYIAPVPIEQKLGECQLIESVCVGGGCLSQPVGMLVLNEELREKPLDAAAKKRIGDELETLLSEINPHLEHHERLDFLVVVKDPWTIDSGILTPTMKVKRQSVEDLYATKFEQWAKQKQALIWES